MGIKDRRRLTQVGKYSTSVTLPTILTKGEEATMAGNRLLLIDPRGEIHEDDLLEFLEKFIEPNFWSWYKHVMKRRENVGEGDI